MDSRDDIMIPEDKLPVGEPLDTSRSEVSVQKTALQFEFSEEEDGLVFNSEADISPTFQRGDEGNNAEDATAEKATDGESSLGTAPEEEFTIPDSFEINPRYNSQSFIEDPIRVRTTYVPRFTEASENYRMAKEPRQRRADAAAPKVDVERNASEEEIHIDPTAEIDESQPTVEKVIVTPSKSSSSEPKDESISIFKFVPNEEEEPKEETLDDSIAVTEELTEESSPLADTTEEEVAEESDETDEERADAPRDIPDPDTGVIEIDYASDAETAYAEEDPHGASDSPLKTAGQGRFEYKSTVQRDDVKDSFLDSIMSLKVRLIASVILVLIMTVIQCLEAFGINVMNLVGLHNVPAGIYAVIDLQFCICLALLALPELIRVVRYMFLGKLLPEINLIVSLVVLIVYTVITATVGAIEYPVFGLLYGVQAVSAIIASFVRRKAEFLSFKVISKNSVKNIIDKRLTRTLPRENLALDGAVDEYSSNTARVFRATFVSDFFANCAKVTENTVNTVITLGAGLGISLITGVVCFFLGEGAIDYAAQAFAMVFMIACPAFSVLIHKIPFHRLALEAESEKSAFVGESSVLSYSDVDVIAYEDTEIFGEEDVSIRKVHLYGKAYNTPKAMKQMYSLFSVVGGPLDRMFSASLDRKYEPASDVIIEEDGICGMVDGHRVCAGTEEYMIRNKIIIPADSYRTGSSTTDSTKVMYGAEDGEVYVKFFIRYSFSEEFTMLLPILKEKKIIPLIYTRDPNITNDLLKVLTMGEDLIRVMKKKVPRNTEEKVYRRVSAGAVTLGDKSCAINMILLAKEYKAFQSGLSVTELVSMVVGAAFAVLLSLGRMLLVPMIALALWQVAWCVVLYCISRRHFGPVKKPSHTDDED